MAVKWTKQQRQVIDLRDCNLLVSAAAGSGKTAVLVERILSRITDKEHPLDLERLIVVTFTKAAAAEMKERLRLALEEKLEEEPDNERVRSQHMALHHARISTIDGFCSYLIKNYFHVCDLDPSCRIADEKELALIRADVAAELLEDHFAEGSKDFFDFVEFFAFGKNDGQLDELILKLYDFADAHPRPEEWLSGCAESYACTTAVEFLQSPVGQMMQNLTEQELQTARQCAAQGLTVTEQPGGPIYYQAFFREELSFIEWLCEDHDWEKRALGIREHVPPRVRANKKAEYDGELVEKAGAYAEEYRSVLKRLRENFCACSLDQELALSEKCAGPARTFAELTKEFAVRYRAKKREKKLRDFSDLEHDALSILVQPDGSPSETARSLQRYYQEIYIDEYQDSNLLQEMILNSISRQTDTEGNLFMVGDVKQSIYKFRQARPDLFLEKLDRYGGSDESMTGIRDRKVLLHQNFRSRNEVLESVNSVFFACMQRQVGGISYDREAALYCGASYEQTENEDYRTEVLYTVRDRTSDCEYTNEQLEAIMLTERIQKLVDQEEGLLITERDGSRRRAVYSDVVILVRSRVNQAEVFVNTLMDAGIPAYSESVTGFFQTFEIETMVNYLYLLDNYRQDLPLASVLRSPFVGLNSEELAQIRIAFPDLAFYEAAQNYAVYGMEEKLREKLQNFYRQYAQFRGALADTQIHVLLWDIMHQTGVYDYFRAMPAGELRAANLQMLLRQAEAYEKSTYKGLYHFVRYLEQLKKYEIDLGEASVVHESMNAVRIMTIHKSKGLEFPIVFLSGLNHRFHDADERELALMHADLGIGLDVVDAKLRTKAVSLQKRVMKRQLRLESRAEELRILYVAMTRAREKLILTAVADSKTMPERREGPMSFGEIVDGSSYWKWLYSLVGGQPGLFVCHETPLSQLCEVLDQSDRARQRVTVSDKKVSPHMTVAASVSIDAAPADRKRAEELERRLSYQYPYSMSVYPTKLSVTELKKREQQIADGEEETVYLYEEANTKQEQKTGDNSRPVPRFLSGVQETRPASVGTAYHKVMQCMDYSREMDGNSIKQFVDSLVKEGRLEKRLAQQIRTEDLLAFLQSDLGLRMYAAAKAGTLRREQPFMFSIRAQEVYEEAAEDAEPLLVQGIIDAYFEENGQWILVDYKTDHVNHRNGKELLKKRYEMQLRYYAKALSSLTGKPVSERVIYSFALGEAFTV